MNSLRRRSAPSIRMPPLPTPTFRQMTTGRLNRMLILPQATQAAQLRHPPSVNRRTADLHPLTCARTQPVTQDTDSVQGCTARTGCPADQRAPHHHRSSRLLTSSEISARCEAAYFHPPTVFIPGEQASQSPALILRWPSTVDGWAVERVVERGPRNSSAISAMGAIRRVICAGHAIDAGKQAPRNA